MIDRDGKLFGKISIIDLAIILLVIAFGIGIYLKFGVMDETRATQEDAPMSFQIKYENTRDIIAENFQVGDTMYSGDGAELGEITDIKSEPAVQSYNDLSGKVKKASLEDRYDITITIEGEGTYTSDGKFMLNRTYELNQGSNRYFKTKYVSFSAIIQEINWDGAA